MRTIFQIFCLLLAATMATACNNTEENEWLPEVKVGTIVTTDITATSAISSGHISGSIEDITEFDICWGASAEPTVNGSHAASDESPESFASYTMGLTPGTTFYVRAYATLASGTVYGNA